MPPHVTLPLNARVGAVVAITLQYQFSVTGPSGTTAYVDLESFMSASGGYAPGLLLLSLDGFRIDGPSGVWASTYLCGGNVSPTLQRNTRDLQGNLTYNSVPSPAAGNTSRVHGIVRGGGLSFDGERWVSCKPGFFLLVRVLSRLFRRLFLAEPEQVHRRGDLQFSGEYAALTDPCAFAQWIAPMRACEWVVHAKRPFAGPEVVLGLARRSRNRAGRPRFDADIRHAENGGDMTSSAKWAQPLPIVIKMW